MRLLILLATLLGLGSLVLADPPAKPKRTRGHKTPPPAILAARHALAFKRHDSRMKFLPKATPAQYDLRTLNRTGPIQDQGQCGSCWDVSACGVCTDAFIASGQFAATDATLTLSPQYVLDCGQNGGCNGDDAPTVLDMAKGKGLPTTGDYGPYTAAPGPCKYTNQKLYVIADWGYCTPSQQQGVASTQDMKNALVQYGTLSTAIAADNSWDSVGADGVIPYAVLTTADVNHDVAIVGWDDGKQIPGAPTPGAWIVKNQWGKDWAANGYCFVAYASHQIGTEAAWATTGQLPPPPPPPVGVPTLVGVTATFSDGSIQTLTGGKGLTAAQLQGMTLQQLTDFINAGKEKPKPMPPAPKQSWRPADTQTQVERLLAELDGRPWTSIEGETWGSKAHVERLLNEMRRDRPVAKLPWQPAGTLARIESRPSPKLDTPPRSRVVLPLSPATATRKALVSGKPLLTWVGGDFCPN